MGNADDMWVDEVLKQLPSVPVPAALQARILGDFDAHPARRILFDRLRDAVWPGAPLWRPASALAAALAFGLAVGTFVPLEQASASSEQTASIKLDQPPSYVDSGENS